MGGGAMVGNAIVGNGILGRPGNEIVGGVVGIGIPTKVKEVSVR